MSVKRKDQLKEFCNFAYGHVETRWLSLLRVIVRVLEIWPALKSYFDSYPKPGRVRRIRNQLCDKTKLFLLFLIFLLPTISAFNVAYTTIHQLHPEIKRLTKLYFVDINVINIDDITKTSFKCKVVSWMTKSFKLGRR